MWMALRVHTGHQPGVQRGVVVVFQVLWEVRVSTEAGRFGYRQELHRSVGTADLVFYGLIFMVPIAPFAIFGAVFSASGGMPALAYVVGMVALVFTAASYGQMVKAFPLSGLCL